MTTMETPIQLPASSTNDTPIDESLLELNEAEQKAIDAATQDIAAAKQSKDAAEAVATPAHADASAKAAEPAAVDGAAATTDATDADPLPDVTVSRDAPQIQTLPVPHIIGGEAPKFDEAQAAIDKQRDEIDAAYDKGDLTAIEFRKRDREISRRELELATQRARFDTALQTQKAFVDQANKASEDAWTSDYRAFTLDPQNAELFKTTLHWNAFQGALNAVQDDREKQKLTPLNNQALLDEARKVFMRVMGVKDPAVVAADAAAKKAKDAGPPQRKTLAQDEIPRTVGQVPAAGADTSDATTIDTLFSEDINDLEDRFARMPRHELDTLLRKLPGATATGNAEA